MPVSCTSKRNPLGAAERSAMRIAPAPVNFTALPTRLLSICLMRKPSARYRRSGTSRNSALSVKPFCRALCSNKRRTSSITARGENGAEETTTRPASMRDKSNMSLRIATRLRPDSTTVRA